MVEARRSVIWKIVYQSDFTKPTGWDEQYSSRVKAFRRDGYYHIAVYDGSYGAWSGPLDVVDSFKAQVDLELNIQSGKTAECGMVFCAEEACDTYFFFAFTVCRNGFYRLYRVSNRNVRFIIDGKSSEIINRGDGTNSLSIEKKECVVTLGINGQIVAKTGDNELRPGRVGMYVCSFKDDLYAEARFRNFVIQRLDTVYWHLYG